RPHGSQPSDHSHRCPVLVQPPQPLSSTSRDDVTGRDRCASPWSKNRSGSQGSERRRSHSSVRRLSTCVCRGVLKSSPLNQETLCRFASTSPNYPTKSFWRS